QSPPDGLVALSSVVRANGPFGDVIRLAIDDAWIADEYERGAAASRLTSLPIATLAGDVFRGPHVVSGGGREDARGILGTKREIKELRDRVAAEREDLSRLADETAALEATISQTLNAIAALNAEQHRQEKAIVAFEGQLARTADEGVRL